MKAVEAMDMLQVLAIAALIGLSVSVSVSADLSLPGIFGDNMVLQQGTEVPVWGRATSGRRITVECAAQSVQTTADSSGEWTLQLEPMDYGGPHEFVVTTDAGETFRCLNVYIGEVWLASGQSNMAMAVARAMNADEEIANSENPLIRHFGTRRTYSTEPLDDLSGSWEVAGPETTGHFTAAGYFFARTLHEELGVAVGIINSSWGGTPVRAWTRREEIQSDPTFAPMLENFAEQFERQEQIAQEYSRATAEWRREVQRCKREGQTPPDRPSIPRGSPHRMPGVLYNGMIAPVSPYAVAATIWYQGEADARPGQAELYEDLFTHLIEGWRDDFGRPEMPFIFVQLPNFRGNSAWPLLRESQLNVLRDLHNTGMAVTIDVGMTDNIHPLNKQAVGRRLALWSLGTTYDREIVRSGPLVRNVTFEGREAVVHFDHADDGLQFEGEMPLGFEIAGEDRKFYPARVTIEGSSVRLSRPAVARPVAVRYGWDADPQCNLYNGDGLPASPFRTDNWDQ